MNSAQQKLLIKKHNNARSLSLGFMLLLTIIAMLKFNVTVAAAPDNHPLIGKFWSVEKQQFVDLSEVKSAVLQSDHVIVGETHDNIDHHRFQAQILAWFVEEKQAINPVFEMLSDEQLQPIQKTRPISSDSFFDKVSWEKNGWPDRKLYKPVFEIVIQNNLPIIAAETDRDVLMQLMKNGEDGLPSEIKKYLSLIKLDENAKKQIHQEIVESHCGMLPDKMIEPMILGQRVRDAVMTSSMIKAAEHGATLLIAGSGHGRTDYGVPAYLKGLDQKTRVTSIAMMEVVDEAPNPADYAKAWSSDTMPFSFVLFTHRMDREDPCEELKQHFKKHPA